MSTSYISKLVIALLLVSCANWHFESCSAQNVLIDLGNDLSYRGASVSNPDPNGNYWNSVWGGAFYPNLLDTSGVATSIDFGFTTIVGNDSYNGPAGVTPSNGPQNSVYNAAALGNLGVDEAVYDYYVNSTFQLQSLDPGATYDLTFFGSHKYNNDDTTRYTIYTDATFSTAISSVDLFVGTGPNHNQANTATLAGVSPQADGSFYVGFEGANGGNGYLNALQLAPASPPQPTEPKVYMHYMPWFNTPDTLGSGNWGWHWTMNNQNPNTIDSSGKRQIASHYYPKIGPYDSSDPDVIEYHLLLMKMAGVDGVLIDWYGVQGANGDVSRILTNSNAIVDGVVEHGLEFGVVLEDRFSTFGIGGPPDVSKAEANIAYLRDNYFNKPEYIRLNESQNPLLPVFGPITFDSEAEWTQILSQAGEPVDFLPLWYQSNDAGSNADGEYAWIYETPGTNDHFVQQTNFYNTRVPTLGLAGGSIYPGFDDFYQEGGAGSSLLDIPHDSGQTLDNLILLADANRENVDFFQLNTWNDFGEGTIFEPTIETGFEYLKKIQQFTGSPFSEEELELVYRLYLARKKYEGIASTQAVLDAVAQSVANFDISMAETLLDSVAPAGDYDGNGLVDPNDYFIWIQSYGTETILHGSGADGNYDGLINAADFTVWRDSFGMLSSTSIPEPGTLVFTITGAFLMPFGIKPRSKRSSRDKHPFNDNQQIVKLLLTKSS